MYKQTFGQEVRFELWLNTIEVGDFDSHHAYLFHLVHDTSTTEYKVSVAFLNALEVCKTTDEKKMIVSVYNDYLNEQ